MVEDYKDLVQKRYAEEAENKKLSLSSTMADLNVRRLEIENLVKHLEDQMKCLEVGCGNGAASVEVSKLRNLDLLSIDQNEEMIKLAKQQPTKGIKGKIEFLQKDILDLNFIELFDVVFSYRCIINLLSWNDQKTALTNIAKSIKKEGILVILEAFSDGLSELNQARKELGLDEIQPAYHNLHLNKDATIEHLKNFGLELSKEDNFLSSYYFGSRVLYPALAKANKLEMVKNSKIDYFFSFLPSIGNFSHIKILKFKKTR